jgi:NADH-quinone oxidoreductase subunit C
MAEEEKPEEQPEAKPEEVKETPAEKSEETPAEKQEEKSAEKTEEKEEEKPKKKPVPKSKLLDEIKKALGDKVIKAWVQRERRIYIAIKGGDITDVTKGIHEMGFDHLSSVSGVEYEDRMECVYHVWSYEKRDLLTIRALVSKDDPRIDSVTPIYESANWLERETYDLLGIKFEGHPDLRRVLLPDDFKGHPLRKDFELTEKPW